MFSEHLSHIKFILLEMMTETKEAAYFMTNAAQHKRLVS